MNMIRITVNGETVEALVEPRTHLADFLREHLHLTGTHLGCEHGVCGACTVLLDEAPVRSCITFAVACDRREVRTIEGFDDDPDMKTLREAFKREHALQCGFCTPGMLITARDILRRVPGADEQRIRLELSGNLCRCTGYVGIVRALESEIEARGAVQTPSFNSEAVIAQPPLEVFAPAELDAQPLAEMTKENRRPANHVEANFVVEQPVDQVWAVFADMPAVAACLPGAEIIEHSERTIKARITTKLGPMRAVFTGSAALHRDDAEKRGRILGAGVDSLSGSRARGDISYVLHERNERSTNINVTIDYNLQGPLAQFSRGGLVTEFVQKLVSQFAANLNARLRNADQKSATPRASTQTIDMGGVLVKWLWSRVRLRFRERFPRPVQQNKRSDHEGTTR